MNKLLFYVFIIKICTSLKVGFLSSKNSQCSPATTDTNKDNNQPFSLQIAITDSLRNNVNVPTEGVIRGSALEQFNSQIRAGLNEQNLQQVNSLEELYFDNQNMISQTSQCADLTVFDCKSLTFLRSLPSSIEIACAVASTDTTKIETQVHMLISTVDDTQAKNWNISVVQGTTVDWVIWNDKKCCQESFISFPLRNMNTLKLKFSNRETKVTEERTLTPKIGDSFALLGVMVKFMSLVSPPDNAVALPFVILPTKMKRNIQKFYMEIQSAYFKDENSLFDQTQSDIMSTEFPFAFYGSLNVDSKQQNFHITSNLVTVSKTDSRSTTKKFYLGTNIVKNPLEKRKITFNNNEIEFEMNFLEELENTVKEASVGKRVKFSISQSSNKYDKVSLCMVSETITSCRPSTLTSSNNNLHGYFPHHHRAVWIMKFEDQTIVVKRDKDGNASPQNFVFTHNNEQVQFDFSISLEEIPLHTYPQQFNTSPIFLPKWAT